MPITPIGDALADRHRSSQVLTAEKVIQEGYRRAGLVQPGNRQSTQAFFDLTFPALRQGRRDSRGLAGKYYQQLRVVESGAVDQDFLEDEGRDLSVAERYRRSLDFFVDNKYTKSLDSGVPAAKARQSFANDVAGTLVRHTLDAGRDQIIENVRRDRVATGFVRITAGDIKVCYFCAMLASRIDYKEGSFDRSDARFVAGGDAMANAKVHDLCRCSVRALWDDDIPDSTVRFQDLWYDLSGNGSDPLRSFRSGWEKLIRSGALPLAG